MLMLDGRLKMLCMASRGLSSGVLFVHTDGVVVAAALDTDYHGGILYSGDTPGATACMACCDVLMQGLIYLPIESQI